MDETYVHSSHIYQKSWSDSSNKGIQKPVSKGQMLVIVNAGGESGFVKNAYLRYKPTIKTGYYHDAMNYDNYKKWLQDKLIPNLPPNSVLVIDNAPYHNVQTEKCPTMSSRKAEIQQWLTTRNISFTDGMLKFELYIIKLHKPRFKTYEIDKVLEEKGHSVLRLPPYHPDLNPIELVWASMKQYVTEKNVSFDFKLVESLYDEFFNSFSVEQWKKRCEHVKKIEQSYMAQQPAFDTVVDQIIINVGVDTDSDCENDWIDSDSESDDS
ncbi:uncharacterized protein LOC126891099 [Diabrotica virgifera virgifera]|uniref:Tc1-like transposase DDE domain-containing protein n=1 Tax=Diabrotica virgifera virgifera TaxID=50390 RepID=A0ABM5L1B6_DIAVI|nr:uncharacterized protein LOC126891099 [Diabrotica virgifera virgifera]